MSTSEEQISVTVQQDGTTATIKVIGWITTVTAYQVEHILSQVPDTTTTLVFDMSETEYISSYGIRLFIMSHKKLTGRGGRFVIRRPNEFVIETLTIAGVFGVFEVEL